MAAARRQSIPHRFVGFQKRTRPSNGGSVRSSHGPGEIGSGLMVRNGLDEVRGSEGRRRPCRRRRKRRFLMISTAKTSGPQSALDCDFPNFLLVAVLSPCVHEEL
jgi:hypothetical protein